MYIKRQCPHCLAETDSELMFDGNGSPVYACKNCGVVTEDRDWFWTVTSEKRLLQVIEERKPLGLFLYDSGIEVIGVDNRTGDAWTEEFPDAVECMMWLADWEGRE